MRKWAAVVALILLGAALGTMLIPPPSRSKKNPPPDATPTEQPPVHGNLIVHPEISEPAKTAASVAISNSYKVNGAQSDLDGAVAAPEFTNLAPAIVMEHMRTAFRSYQSTFGANPVGTNPEITKALDGGNPREIHFLDAENGLRLNGKGELIDPWGTPFFFHQLSGVEMEIHSAGPDKIMWTRDDLIIK